LSLFSISLGELLFYLLNSRLVYPLVLFVFVFVEIMAVMGLGEGETIYGVSFYIASFGLGTNLI